MSGAARDPVLTLSEYRTFSIESLLRRVAAARAAGDVRRAQPEWNACVIRATPRVRIAVKAFRTVHGDAIAVHDREVVVNAALERGCRRLIETLDSLTERSFLAAMATCAERACQDHVRALGAYEKHIAGSLDAPAHEDGGDASPYDHHLSHAAHLQRLDDEAALEAADRVRRALAEMANPQRRRAVELKELGTPYHEIAEQLDVSVDNAYQLVSRGMRDLAKLMEP